MSKGKNRGGYPYYYRKNVIRNAERRYRKEKKTKAAVLSEKRQRVVDTLSKYIQLSLTNYFKATQEQIDRAGAEVDTLSRWYKGIVDTQGEDRAKKLLNEKTSGFLPDNFWMPSNIAFNVDEMAAAREAGDITARIWCVAVNKVFGYDKKQLTKVLRGANAIYKSDIDETDK